MTGAMACVSRLESMQNRRGAVISTLISFRMVYAVHFLKTERVWWHSVQELLRLLLRIRKLGRVVRTCFLLEYVNSEELRSLIQSATNRCESFKKFAQWVYFASDLIQEYLREEQLKAIKYDHLIANLLVFHNCKSMTQALKELQDEGRY